VRVSRSSLTSRRGSDGGVGGGADRHADEALGFALESVLEQTVLLEAIPQLIFEVSVEIVTSGVADLACAAVAASASLIHAGVRCVDVVAAATVALVADGGGILFDPTEEEMGQAMACCTVCACAGSGALAYVEHKGAVDPAAAMALVEAAASGCVTLGASIRAQLAGSCAPSAGSATIDGS
jgi:ribonuclease PH